MQFFPISQLSLLGVGDPGIPNRERIIMRPTEEINLGEYFMILGYIENDKSITPIPNNLFYFGNVLVAPPSWVTLYTGPGRDIESRLKHSKEHVHVFHWNRNHTAFVDPNVVPLLLRIDSLSYTVPVLSVGKPSQGNLTFQA